VESLGDGQRVDAPVREGEAFGAPVARLGRGHLLGKDRAHLRERLDRDHLRAARGEQAGQLAGARGEVDDDAPGASPSVSTR